MERGANLNAEVGMRNSEKRKGNYECGSGNAEKKKEKPELMIFTLNQVIDKCNNFFSLFKPWVYLPLGELNKINIVTFFSFPKSLYFFSTSKNFAAPKNFTIRHIFSRKTAQPRFLCLS